MKKVAVKLGFVSFSALLLVGMSIVQINFLKSARQQGVIEAKAAQDRIPKAQAIAQINLRQEIERGNINRTGECSEPQTGYSYVLCTGYNNEDSVAYSCHFDRVASCWKGDRKSSKDDAMHL